MPVKKLYFDLLVSRRNTLNETYKQNRNHGKDEKMGKKHIKTS